jgi:hypothetical protein
MCIIIASYGGVIDRDELKFSLENNPDGWGFMYPKADGKLSIHKGMKPSEFWGEWQEVPGRPVVFHARIASHGKTDMANCHPFKVQDGLWVCHNGVIWGAVDTKKEPDMSDTRAFIRDTLRKLPEDFLYNEGILSLIRARIGLSKLVFMDNQGNIELIGEELGHWVGDNWYSNSTYEQQKKNILPVGPDVRNNYVPSCFEGFVTVEPEGYWLADGKPPAPALKQSVLVEAPDDDDGKVNCYDCKGDGAIDGVVCDRCSGEGSVQFTGYHIV